MSERPPFGGCTARCALADRGVFAEAATKAAGQAAFAPVRHFARRGDRRSPPR